ncbi:hypothetical protein COY95_04910 [Candidatus Woesearchaeota archaeon CG_4_10_14_0_8_um_filter_47_5]|nr:MAG: hypothetical protein COY95_04910 [Candidatus Woesearchaeota archaeon CG_4_10_14_0_8_um_filter_47_5]
MDYQDMIHIFESRRSKLNKLMMSAKKGKGAELSAALKELELMIKTLEYHREQEHALPQQEVALFSPETPGTSPRLFSKIGNFIAAKVLDMRQS